MRVGAKQRAGRGHGQPTAGHAVADSANHEAPTGRSICDGDHLDRFHEFGGEGIDTAQRPRNDEIEESSVGDGVDNWTGKLPLTLGLVGMLAR